MAYICRNIKQLLKRGKQIDLLSFNGPLDFIKNQINHDPLFIDTVLSLDEGISPFILIMYAFIHSFELMS